jgi:hypothetical protein
MTISGPGLNSISRRDDDLDYWARHPLTLPRRRTVSNLDSLSRLQTRHSMCLLAAGLAPMLGGWVQ